MRNLIDKVNAFESLPLNEQNVSQFNELFSGAPIKDLAGHLLVEIGELADTDTTRFLTVGSLVIKHNFTPAKDLILFTDDGKFQRSKWTGNGQYRDDKRSKWG